MTVFLQDKLYNNGYESTLRGFREFDDQVTAPLHGFRDVEHYYSESSCKQYLKQITVPTCILHSQDDPFMYPSTVPGQDDLPDNVNLILTGKGGHVGFVSGNFPWNAKYWHEEVICDFLKIQLHAVRSCNPVAYK